MSFRFMGHEPKLHDYNHQQWLENISHKKIDSV